MFNLDDVLNSSPYSIDKEPEKEKGPSKVRITPGALNKIKTYARLVERITNSANECYGFLLAAKEGDSEVVVDAYLADNQVYSGAHCRIEGEDVVRASNNVSPEGHKIVGWWHSHAGFSVFHSGTDVNNFKTVAHSVSPNTLKTDYEDVKLEQLVKNDKVDIGGYVIDAKKLKSEDIKKKHSYSWAYSLVVNIKGDVYTEIQLKELGADNQWKLKEPKKDTGHDLVETVDDIVINASQMETEVYQKLRVPRYAAPQKIKKTKEARKWGLFDFVDYFVGAIFGTNKKKDPVSVINQKIQSDLDKLKEKKKQDYEKELEEEKKKEELRKAEEEAEKNEGTPGSLNHTRTAEMFLNAAKAYVAANNADEDKKTWLDNVMAAYVLSNQMSFAEAMASSGDSSKYSRLNLGKKKNRKKFIPRFAEELSSSQSLYELVNGFLEKGSDKNAALEALRAYDPSKVPEKKEEAEEDKHEIPAEKPEGPAGSAAKIEKKADAKDSGTAKRIKDVLENKGQEVPVQVLTEEKTENDSLIDLIKSDLGKKKTDTSAVAERFIDAFGQYIEDSYTDKSLMYNDWAADVMLDYRNGYSGRGELFMRAAECNKLAKRDWYRRGYITPLAYAKTRMIEKATAELLNNPNFRSFVDEFLKEQNKDAVIEKYFKKEEPEKKTSNNSPAWGNGYDAYGCAVYPPGALDAPVVDTSKKNIIVRDYATYQPPETVKQRKPSFEPTAAERDKISERSYNNAFNKFFKAAKEYIFNDGEYSAWLGRFLMQIANEKDDDVKKPIKKTVSDKTKKVIENGTIEKAIKERFNWYANGKPGMEEIKDRAFLEFILEFKPESIPEFYRQMQDFSYENLISNMFAEAFTDYVMEGWCFDKKPCKRKYCSWAGKVLEDIIKPDENMTLGKAIENAGQLSSELLWSTDYFYTTKDTKMIANQLLLDLAYFMSPDKKIIVSDFLVDFVEAYKNNKNDPDKVVEEFMKKFEVEECKK